MGEEVVSLLDGEGTAVGNTHLVDEEDDLVACELVALEVHLFDRDLRVREGVDELNEPVVGERRIYWSATRTAATGKVEHAQRLELLRVFLDPLQHRHRRFLRVDRHYG